VFHSGGSDSTNVLLCLLHSNWLVRLFNLILALYAYNSDVDCQCSSTEPNIMSDQLWLTRRELTAVSLLSWNQAHVSVTNLRFFPWIASYAYQQFHFSVLFGYLLVLIWRSLTHLDFCSSVSLHAFPTVAVKKDCHIAGSAANCVEWNEQGSNFIYFTSQKISSSEIIRTYFRILYWV